MSLRGPVRPVAIRFPRPPSPFPMFSNGNLKTPQFSIFNFPFSIVPVRGTADGRVPSLQAGRWRTLCAATGLMPRRANHVQRTNHAQRANHAPQGAIHQAGEPGHELTQGIMNWLLHDFSLRSMIPHAPQGKSCPTDKSCPSGKSRAARRNSLGRQSAVPI